MTAGQLAVIVVASAVGAGIKGVTGMGYPVVAVPIIALVLGVEDAVVIVALPNLAANTYLCWEARAARHETRDLPRLVGFGIVGAVVGTVALVNLPEDPLLVFLAATVAGFVVVFVLRPEVAVSPETSRRWSPAVGSVVGMLQGAIGVSGPVVATWLHGYRLPKQAYVFSVTIVFGVTGFVQVVVLTGQGAFTTDRLLAALAAAVPVAVMTPLGLALRKHLAGPAFDRAVLAVLVLSAASLILKVVQ